MATMIPNNIDDFNTEGERSFNELVPSAEERENAEEMLHQRDKAHLIRA